MTEAGFNDLIRSLSRKLYGYAYRIVRNGNDAEDTVQEVFIRLWQMGDRLDEYTSIEALALTMTRNQCIDTLRKKSHEGPGETAMLHDRTMEEPSPHEIMERDERASALQRILTLMPVNYGDMIRLKEIDGYTYSEISEKTGQNINTIRVTVSRARKMIRDQYNSYLNGKE